MHYVSLVANKLHSRGKQMTGFMRQQQTIFLLHHHNQQMDLQLDRKSSCSSDGPQGQATSVGRGQYHSKEAVNQQQPICHSESNNK